VSVQLLHQHVDRFNAAVRSGDWAQVTAYFTDDAELAFEGVPLGPFHGRESIEAAYRDRPPDDEVLLLGADTLGDEVVAGYAWSKEPDRPAGEMRLTERDGRIARLVVTFD
jgi:steroid delta-isomerase